MSNTRDITLEDSAVTAELDHYDNLVGVHVEIGIGGVVDIIDKLSDLQSAAMRVTALRKERDDLRAAQDEAADNARKEARA